MNYTISTTELSGNLPKHILSRGSSRNHLLVTKKPTGQQHLETNADAQSFQGVGDLENVFDLGFTRHSGLIRVLRLGLVETRLPHAAWVGVVLLAT